MSYSWNKSVRSAGVCVALWVVFFVPSAFATVDVSGFLTLGATTSNSDDLVFRTSIDRWPEKGTNLKTESLLGLQVNYQASDKVDMVLQGVFDHSEHDSIGDYIELAFLRYQLARNWSIRVGRMNHNAYILSEYLEVGYSYLWATPPTEFYTTSSYLSYVDGAELQYRQSLDSGVVQATLAVGTSEADILNLDFHSMLTFKSVATASLTYEADTWMVKGTFSAFEGQRASFPGFRDLRNALGDIPAPLWPEAEGIYQSLDFKDEIVKYSALGYSYNDGQFIVMTELAHLDIDWGFSGDVVYGYGSLGFIVGNFTPYLTYSEIKTTENQITVPPPRYDQIPDQPTAETLGLLQGTFQHIYDTSRLDQTSIALGVRWDIAPQWAVKGQFTRYQLTGTGYGLWGSDFSVVNDQKRNINVLSINVSTVFR